MRPRTWLFTAFASLVLGAALGLAANIWIDIYGLFRNDRGRLLPTYGDERIAKYLLCERYVPTNFDGLLLGPSITSNWKPGRFQNFHIYNASINGSNIVEEKCIADQALASHKMRIALLLVHPSLTLSHTFRTVRLTPRERWAALGSQSLFDAYKDAATRLRKPQELVTDGYGTQYFSDDPHPLNSINTRLMRPHTDFEVDPIALKTYRDLLQEFRSYRMQIVLIVPPLSESLLQTKKPEFDRYSALIRSLAPEQTSFIDFISDRYKPFRQDHANFSDGIHLTRRGADRIADEVNNYLKNMQVQGQFSASGQAASYSDPAGPLSTSSIISKSGLASQAMLR
jgi:hypothetical protein